MTKPIHIVFAIHNRDGKSFLFAVPSDDQILCGEMIYVNTSRGETTAQACSSSFWVTKEQLKQIVAGTGAYLPLKRVTGRQILVSRVEKVALSPAERRRL